MFFKREILVFVSASTDVGAPTVEPPADPVGLFRPPVIVPGRVAGLEGDPFVILLLLAATVFELNDDWLPGWERLTAVPTVAAFDTATALKAGSDSWTEEDWGVLLFGVMEGERDLVF